MLPIRTTFAKLKREGRKALIPFINAADSGKGYTVPLMHVLAKEGATLLNWECP